MKRIRFILGLLVSFICLYAVFRGTDFDKIWTAIISIKVVWLFPACIIYFLGIWVRALRWGYILKPIRRCPISKLFPVYLISYMANNILPLRAGDFYRAYITGRKESVSKAAVLTTVGVERIFDGLTMLAFLVIVSLFFPFQDSVQKWIRPTAYLFLGMMVFCYLLIWKRAWALKLVTWFCRYLPERFRERVQMVSVSLLDGLQVLTGPRDMLVISVLSLLTWLIETVMYYFVGLGFGINIPYHGWISALALVNLAIIIPAAPGYFGPFEFACDLILRTYGVGESIRKGYALVLHAAQWFPSTLLGLVYVWKEQISLGRIRTEPEVEAVSQDPAETLI